jgi:cytosine/adenosine deaminase-related metal-dependent hydrolase
MTLVLPGAGRRLARKCSISVDRGRISAIESGVHPAPTDERHAILLPGLPNLHSHAFQRGMAGLAERAGDGDDSFWTWREAMYHFVDRLDPDGMRAIARWPMPRCWKAALRAWASFTIFIMADGQPYNEVAIMAQAVAAAADETRIGLTLLPVFYAHSGLAAGRRPMDNVTSVNDIARFQSLLHGARDAVAGLDAPTLWSAWRRAAYALRPPTN